VSADDWRLTSKQKWLALSKRKEMIKIIRKFPSRPQRKKIYLLHHHSSSGGGRSTRLAERKEKRPDWVFFFKAKAWCVSTCASHDRTTQKKRDQRGKWRIKKRRKKPHVTAWGGTRNNEFPFVLLLHNDLKRKEEKKVSWLAFNSDR